MGSGTMPTTEGHTLVFGLTADPIHAGHEQVIHNSFAFAKDHDLVIKQFLLVPTYQPNLIAGKQQPRTAFKHRKAMCEQVATEIIKQFNYPVYVSDVEKQLYESTGQKSYSIDTLAAIEASSKLFVLSADHFAGRWPKFRQWHHWQALVKANGLLIHQRPGHGLNTAFIRHLQAINPHVHVVKDLPSVDVSSTQIRNSGPNQALQQGWISEPVYHYIQAHHLYA